MKEQFLQEVKSAFPYKSFNQLDANTVSIELDRFRRHDHGGGSDGDGWLDDYEIQKDFEEGKRKHQHKLDKVLGLIEGHQINAQAEFYLGEKGHFSIEIWFNS